MRTVLNVANYLAENGYDIEIISVFKFNKEASFYIDPRIKIKVLVDRKKSNGSGITGKIKSDLRKIRSFVIHPDDEAYSFFSLFSDIKMIRYLKTIKKGILITTRPSFNILATKYINKNVTLIGQEHLNITIYPARMKNSIIKSYGKLDYLATLTDADTKDYEDLLNNQKVSVIKLTNSVPRLEHVKSNLENKVIIAAGRLVNQKGFDLLIDAFEIVKERYPDWKVKIFGKGRDKRDLTLRIIEKGLYNHVLLMGPTNDIELELENASIFALSSRYEGFGMVIVEAMQCGVPVVSFDCPRGPGEIITHGEDGILVEDGNINEFAKELMNLMGNYEKRKELGNNAIDSVKKYEIDVIGNEWIKLFEKIKSNK
ncbi:glycosyltransferase family 4 protein [Romboutsia faecis]|uniref:glycosyltransferase family 4 protein n=1 Tax=Romboutsia faecis TaxID=2764597 RepID=UPI001A9AF7B2|nr:glycosyltransferase family 4 protein [Romboutsia faecis]